MNTEPSIDRLTLRVVVVVVGVVVVVVVVIVVVVASGGNISPPLNEVVNKLFKSFEF